MRYRQPVNQSSALKQDALEETLEVFRQEIRKVKRKQKGLQKLCKRVDNALTLQTIKLQVQEHDESEAQPLLKSLDNLLKNHQRTAQLNKNRHEATCKALDGLAGEIRSRADEVNMQSAQLKDAAFQWQAANNFVQDCCQRASYRAYDKFQSWTQITPVLNTWLNSEGQLQRSIYASSWLFGMHTELIAHSEITALLQDFEETHYSKLSQIPTHQLPTLKQVQEQRQARSEAFDQLHWRLLKQLRLMVKQCDYLQLEIESREHIRTRLKALTMELHSALEEDCEEAIQQVAQAARISLDSVVQTLFGLQESERQQIVASLIHPSSRLHPNTLDDYVDADDVPQEEASLAGREGEDNKPALAEQSQVSSLSGDDNLSDLARAELKYIHSRHLQLRANDNGARGGGDSSPIPQAKLDKLFGIPPASSRTNKALRSHTRDLPRNLDRIHIRLRSLYEAIHQLSPDDNTHSDPAAGNNKIVGSRPPRDGKDPLYELLAFKKAIRRMQACCTHASYDAASMSFNKSFLGVFPSPTDDNLPHSSIMDEGHIRMSAAFASSRHDMEHLIDQAIIEKYRVGLNLLNSELSKHSWYTPIATPPATASTPSRRSTSRASQFGLLDESGYFFPSRTQTQEENRASFIQVGHFPVEASALVGGGAGGMIDRIDSQGEQEEEEDSVNEEELLQNNEQILEGINKQLSVELLDIREVRRQVEEKKRQKAAEDRLKAQALDAGLETSSPSGRELTMQIIVDGDHFHVNFYYQPVLQEAVLIARKYINRKSYQEYTLHIPISCLVEVCGWDDEGVVKLLTNDRLKFYQSIRDHFHVERLPSQYYDQVMQSAVKGGKPGAFTGVQQMEEVLRTAAAESASNRPLVEETNNVMTVHMLKVLTLRSRTKGLLRYALPIIYDLPDSS